MMYVKRETTKTENVYKIRLEQILVFNKPNIPYPSLCQN